MTTADTVARTGAALDPENVSGADIAARSPLALFLRRLRRDRVAMAALGFIALLVIVALMAPLIVKLLGLEGPTRQNPRALDEFGTPTGPSGAHPFGVDELGRDVLSRVLYGARASLQVAIVATALSVAIGVTLGLVAGYFRGKVDMLISRLLMDLLLSFPILLLALGLAAACSLGDGCLDSIGPIDFGRGLIQPGLGVVIFVIAFVNWVYIGRIIRGQTLSLREKEFVEAARASGASNARIMFREILPNLVAPIIVYSTLIIPTNILFEAALSFLGVGVQPPDPSWGDMIAEATDIFDIAPWYMFFPGAALVLTVLAFNLLGDGLQDALDPRVRR